jgi:hypothetical protein
MFHLCNGAANIKKSGNKILGTGVIFHLMVEVLLSPLLMVQTHAPNKKVLVL